MTALDQRLPSNIEDLASHAVNNLLPKSKVKYEEQYLKYEQWCKSRGIEEVASEKVLLTYFSYMSTSHKPSTLWTFYSMIRSIILLRNNIDIKQYRSITAFLKTISVDFRPKKSKVLSRCDISKFLCEADDDKYLFMKVVLIVGLAGACKNQEMLALTVDNVRDEHDYFYFAVPNASNKNRTKQFVVPVGNFQGINLVEMIRKYVSLRPKHVNHGRFFIQYINKKCTCQPVGKNKFGDIPKSIATFLKLENPEMYTGHCFKKSSRFF